MNDEIAYDRIVFEYAKNYARKKYKKQLPDESTEKLVYVIYARKSSTSEYKQSESPEQQIEKCFEFAKQHNLEVIEKPIVETQSAHTSDNRPLFRQMLDSIKDKSAKFNAILAWHPDRLSRNMKEAGEIIDLLDQKVIKDLKFTSYFFVNDSAGKLALGIQFAIAKQYSDSISTNTARGMNYKVEKGNYLV